MRNPLTSPGATSLGLLLARVPLGVLFVVAGFSKFARAGGVTEFVAHSATLVPAWVPQAAGAAYLGVLPCAEIIVGASLVLGVVGRLGGLLASLMLAGFMVVATGALTANGSPHPNVMSLGVALLVVLAGPGSLSMDRVMWGNPEPNAARTERWRALRPPKQSR